MTDRLKWKFGGARVTDKEKATLEAYTNKHKKTFMDKTASCEAAGYTAPRTAAVEVFKRPRIEMALKEMMSEPEIDTMISKRFKKVLAKGGREFLPVCREIFKIRGDYAPEKQVQVSMTADELKREREEYIQEIKTERKKIGITNEDKLLKGDKDGKV